MGPPKIGRTKEGHEGFFTGKFMGVFARWPKKVAVITRCGKAGFHCIWENLISVQSIFPLVIILLILITFSLDYASLFLGETWCYSLLGLKRLILHCISRWWFIWLHSVFHVPAWIGSIAFGVNFLFGPVASSLCQRFSCRLVAAAGGLIAVFGFLMTSFANSVYFIYFTYSVVWGFGSSLSFATTTFVLGDVRWVEVDISQLINNVLNFISPAVPLPFFHPIFV